MNPDSNINVVATYPSGLAVVYGHIVEEDGEPLPRPRLYSRHFPTYGAARLFAQDYEHNQREERARRTK